MRRDGPAMGQLCTDVLLADDHAMLREGLQAILERESDLRVVASVADGREALRLAVRLRPRVAVLDVAMPGMGGIEAARGIAKNAPGVAVLMLSAHGAPELLRQSFEAGAAGFLAKEHAVSELVHAVRLLAAGRRYADGGLAAEFAGLLADRRRVPGARHALTAREREVVRLVAEGKSNAQAALSLGLSPRTVETYRGRAMQKLGIDSVADLVKYAIRHGLTSVD